MVVSELYKIIGMGLLTLIAYLIIKPLKPELAIFVSLVGSCIILLACIDGLMEVITTMTTFVEKTGISSELFSCVLKIIGIGYITEFGANICINSGNTAIADMLSLAGKVTILVLSLPIVTNLMNVIIQILP
ncbi:MAG: stage III sporulation protein AD [Clostridiales bacterium]|nr:stage III sporulation protein AD [Clostridiales bacterium]